MFYCFIDAPKFISNQTIYYSWEGNPINISCDVKSNPPASVHWRREKLVLPAKNTTNLKTYSTGRKVILEVSPCVHINKLYYFSHYLLFYNMFKNLNKWIYYHMFMLQNAYKTCVYLLKREILCIWIMTH